MKVIPMPVRSRLRILVAEKNLERVKAGEPALTVRMLAAQADLAPSTINALMTNRAQGVQFDTLEKLCKYFDVNPGELFVRENKEEVEDKDAK